MTQRESAEYPPFSLQQVDELLRAWGIRIPGDVESNVKRAKEAFTWLQDHGVMNPISEETLAGYRWGRELQLQTLGKTTIPEDPEEAFLLNITTGGVFYGTHRTTGAEFDGRWRDYQMELIVTPLIKRFALIPWVWPLPGAKFLDLPRQPDWHPVIPFLLQQQTQDALWAILRFRLWKDGTRGYLEGRWDPQLQRERFDLCDFDLRGKVNQDLVTLARTVSELGKSGRTPGLTAVEPMGRITMLREKAREFIADGLPATQVAIGQALGLSESTVQRYVRAEGFRDWRDFLARGL